MHIHMHKIDECNEDQSTIKIMKNGTRMVIKALVGIYHQTQWRGTSLHQLFVLMNTVQQRAAIVCVETCAARFEHACCYPAASVLRGHVFGEMRC